MFSSPLFHSPSTLNEKQNKTNTRRHLKAQSVPHKLGTLIGVAMRLLISFHTSTITRKSINTYQHRIKNLFPRILQYKNVSPSYPFLVCSLSLSALRHPLSPPTLPPKCQHDGHIWSRLQLVININMRFDEQQSRCCCCWSSSFFFFSASAFTSSGLRIFW